MTLKDKAARILTGILGRSLAGSGAQPNGAAMLDALRGHCEQQKKILANGVYVPAFYVIRLSPDAYAAIVPLKTAIGRELEEEFGAYLKRGGYRCVRPSVSIRFQQQFTIAPGGIAVTSHFQEQTSDDEPGKAEVVRETPGKAEPPPQPCARLVLRPAAGETRSVSFSPGTFIIGRFGDADLLLPTTDRAASKRHCQLTVKEDGVVIVQDLHSTNGTVVNGQRILVPCLLQPGDRLTLGTSELELLP